MTKSTSGPAFPVSVIELRQVGDEERVVNVEYAGLSVRDWYAGQALSGLLASGDCPDIEQAVSWAWDAADLMVAERELRDS